MKITKRKFTSDFKAEAVKLWEASGRRSKEIGEQLGIRPELLNQWKHAIERQKTSPARCPNTQAPGSSSDAVAGKWVGKHITLRDQPAKQCAKDR